MDNFSMFSFYFIKNSPYNSPDR